MAKFDKVILPGQEGKIEMVVEGDKVHGEFSKSAQVHSNDPAHPQLAITVAGYEVPYVNVVPEGNVYLHGRYNEKIEKVLTLTSNEKDLDFKVTGISSNLDDKITYRLEDGSRPGEYLLHVYKNPKLPTLSTYGSLNVHTNSPNAPQSTLQVHVMTKGAITVSPAMVNFGAVKFADEAGPGTPVTKSVIVSKAAGEFRIKGVTLSNGAFVSATETVSEGKQYRLQITFMPPAKKKTKQNETAELIIQTDDPMEPAVRVQVVARAM